MQNDKKQDLEVIRRLTN